MTRLLPLSLVLALVGCNGSAAPDDAKADTGGGEDAVDWAQNDADGDTIIDTHEGDGDADGDGKANMDDRDSDGDVIRDAVEAGDELYETRPFDTDGDGVPDFLDDDSDGNCILDTDEAGRDDGGAVDTDGDGVRDFQDDDNDGDGISDIDEVGGCEGSPTDTDADGTPDYMDVDSDNDGIGDIWEAGTNEFDTTPEDTDGDGIPDYQDSDSDNDGISDADEAGTGGDPSVEPRDTDGDGRGDYADTDSDGDALSDSDELALGTDPYDGDTDGDGYSDGGEVTAGTDPLDEESIVDGLYVEVPERTTVEESFEFELSIDRGDVGTITDTTCSMSGTISAINSEFSTIVTDLSEDLPDLAFGVAWHDDYAYGSFGSPGSDKPYGIYQQVTTDTTLVQAALATMGTHSGADGPESGTEAVYQAASGMGYDQDCDGSYDASTDVYPFVADASDPFGGSGGEWNDSTTPDGGTNGGMGFREYALPVIVLATDNYMRDPESSNAYYNSAPGGCPQDAGMSDAVTAFLDLGAYFVGVAVNGSLAEPQMLDLAQQTGSYADLDEDGLVDEEAVSVWTGSSADFRETLVTAISQLVAGVRFDRVDLSIPDDTYGFVTSIEPEYYEGLGAEDEGQTLDFTLTFRGVVAATTEDQLYKLTLTVLGDQSILLDELDIIVVVPGTKY
jgi:hypothetical protein